MKTQEKPKIKVTMHGAEMFPTRYATGSDLHDKAYTLEIAAVQKETMTDPHTFAEIEKFVIYFKGAQRGFVLGKQFAESIADATAEPEATHWTGKRVQLYPIKTQLGIGVRARRAENGTTPPPTELQDEDE